MLELLWIIFGSISIILLYLNVLIFILLVIFYAVGFILKKTDIFSKYEPIIDKIMRYFFITEFTVLSILFFLAFLLNKGIFANEHVLFN